MRYMYWYSSHYNRHGNCVGYVKFLVYDITRYKLRADYGDIVQNHRIAIMSLMQLLLYFRVRMEIDLRIIVRH